MGGKKGIKIFCDETEHYRQFARVLFKEGCGTNTTRKILKDSMAARIPAGIDIKSHWTLINLKCVT